MTQPYEPTEPDLRTDLSDEEADALLDHTLATLNEARTELGLPPLAWSDEPEPGQG